MKARLCLSLQELCCQTISLNFEDYESYLVGLSQPCLCLLLEHLSLMNILASADFLKNRGINAHVVASCIQRTQFKHVDAYPIKATTCPHLLNLFPSDGWDWALSKLLYRRLIVRMVEELNLCQSCQRDSPDSKSTEIWPLIRDKYPDVSELFCPQSMSMCDRVKKRITRHWKEKEKRVLSVAAHNILYIIVDLKVCRFLMDPNYEYVFNSFCKSLRVLSLLIKNSSDIMEFVSKMKANASNLEKMCIFAIKNDDMNFYDAILSICSGVSEYYLTKEGQKERKIVKALMLQSDPNDSLQHDDLQDIVQEDNTESERSSSKSEFDLMDDAVLFGATETTKAFDSEHGMLKADFKVTNLVNKHLYVSVLSHHLKHWQVLRELHLGVPELHPKVTAVVCSLIIRPQFRCFTLSSTDFKAHQIEDIFMTVATSRASVPMEKLMFVSVVTKWENVEDIDQHDKMPQENDEEIDHFLQSFESKRLSEVSEFSGTELLEWYSCTLGLQTECLIRQFIKKDRALRKLCFSNSITRRMMTVTLRTVTAVNMPLSQLILEDWRVLSAKDCQVLVQFIKSVSPTLQSFRLTNCVVSRDLYQFTDIIDALLSCKQLRSLDTAMNRLGDDALPLVQRLVGLTDLRELSLRKNHTSYETTMNIFKSLSNVTIRRGKILDVLDLRGNFFSEGDHANHKQLVNNVVKYVLLDPGRGHVIAEHVEAHVALPWR